MSDIIGDLHGPTVVDFQARGGQTRFAAGAGGAIMSSVCVPLLGSLWAGCALQARGRLTRFVDGACGHPSDSSAVGVFRGLPRVGLVERVLDGKRII